MSCIFLCSSFHLFICIQTVPFTNILHSYFVDQLTYISPFTKPSSICKCDKPLEPLSTCPISSNYFYPLQLFYLFICTQTFPFTNILYSYLLNNQLTFPPSPCPLVSVNAISHSCLSAHVLHIFPPLYCSFRSEGAPVHVCSCDFMSFVCLFVQLRL